MAITIKNNTTKLQDLKNKVNALPDKEEGATVVLDQTTVSPADVLVNKTYYFADADGQPVKSTGEMNNLGEINVEVVFCVEQTKDLVRKALNLI
jgi:pullulanase/glycogen debranching enzyme